jgi:DNA-binding transcriptional ArsR family regulator
MISALQIKAKFFRGLADSTRLAILASLVDSERCVSEIVKETGLSQSNVSNHLKCLIGCGVVANRRDGKNVRYRIRDQEMRKLLTMSDRIISKVHSDIARCVHYEE